MTNKHVCPSFMLGRDESGSIGTYNEVQGLSKREHFALEIFKAKATRYKTDRQLMQECIALTDQLLELLKNG